MMTVLRTGKCANAGSNALQLGSFFGIAKKYLYEVCRSNVGSVPHLFMQVYESA